MEGVDYGKMGIQEKSKHLRGKLIYGPVYGRIGTGKSGNIKKNIPRQTCTIILRSVEAEGSYIRQPVKKLSR